MNTKLKKFLSTVLVSTSIVVPNVVNAEVNQKYTTGSETYSLDKTDASSKEIKVYLNGEQLEFDVPPVEINGRTKVPFRKIFESMGTVVWFNEVDNSILGTTIDGEEIRHTNGTNKATINGVEKTYDSISEVINDRTLIPVRMVADLLGADVSWIEKNNEVQIKKDMISNESNQIIKRVLEHALDNNFNPEDFRRYTDYLGKHPEKSVEEVILEVNMDLDKQLEKDTMTIDNGDGTTEEIPVLKAKDEDITVVKNTNSNTVLVNKFNKLPSGYVPSNMLDVQDYFRSDPIFYARYNTECLLKEEAYNSYFEMNNDYLYSEENPYHYSFHTPHGYKSEQEIKELIRSDYYKIMREFPGPTLDEALYFLSRGTFEDLQTGLSFDFAITMATTENYAIYKHSLGYPLTPGYEQEMYNGAIMLGKEEPLVYGSEYDKWIVENSWKYGFVQRYPRGKEYITRILSNGNHFRYVGKEIAKIMHDENLCLEEYVAKYENNTDYKTTEESVQKVLKLK